VSLGSAGARPSRSLLRSACGGGVVRLVPAASASRTRWQLGPPHLGLAVELCRWEARWPSWPERGREKEGRFGTEPSKGTVLIQSLPCVDYPGSPGLNCEWEKRRWLSR
jgi:hypothetical protein